MGRSRLPLPLPCSLGIPDLQRDTRGPASCKKGFFMDTNSSPTPAQDGENRKPRRPNRGFKTELVNGEIVDSPRTPTIAALPAPTSIPPAIQTPVPAGKLLDVGNTTPAVPTAAFEAAQTRHKAEMEAKAAAEPIPLAQVPADIRNEWESRTAWELAQRPEDLRLRDAFDEHCKLAEACETTLQGMGKSGTRQTPLREIKGDVITQWQNCPVGSMENVLDSNVLAWTEFDAARRRGLPQALSAGGGDPYALPEDGSPYVSPGAPAAEPATPEVSTETAGSAAIIYESAPWTGTDRTCNPPLIAELVQPASAKITERSIWTLFCGMARSMTFFDETRAYLSLSCFLLVEGLYRLLFLAMRQLRDGGCTLFTRASLEAACRELDEAEPVKLHPNHMEKLLRANEHGVLWSIFHQPESQIDLNQCRAYLRQFLFERIVADPVRAFSQTVTTDMIPTGLPEFLRTINDAHRRIDEIGKLDDWPERQPLCEPILPEFPLDALPDHFRAWVEAVSEAIQAPAAVAAMLGLGLAGAAAAKLIEIRLKPDWVEPTNPYIVVIMEPGSKKSPVFKLAMQPIREWVKEERKRMQPFVDAYSYKKAALESEKKRLIAQAKKAGNTDEQTAARINGELARLRKYVPPKFSTDDTTPEALETILEQQGGRICIASAEGTPFQSMTGLYTGGRTQLGVYLNGWSSEPVDTARITRDDVNVEKTALTLILTIQPAAWERLSEKPELLGEGLLSRFLPVLPNPIDENLNPEPIDPKITKKWKHLIRALLAMKNPGRPRFSLFSEENRAESEEIPARILRLSDAAAAAFQTHREENKSAKQELDERDPFKPWLNKQCGETARLAAILHLLKLAESAPAVPAYQEPLATPPRRRRAAPLVPTTAPQTRPGVPTPFQPEQLETPLIQACPTTPPVGPGVSGPASPIQSGVNPTAAATAPVVPSAATNPGIPPVVAQRPAPERFEPWGPSVSGPTMTDAIEIMKMLTAHAVRAWELLGRPVGEDRAKWADVRFVVRWLGGKHEFTRSELSQGNKRRFKRVADVDPVLETLIDLGHIRPDGKEPVYKRKGGQPPSAGFKVHPETTAGR